MASGVEGPGKVPKWGAGLDSGSIPGVLNPRHAEEGRAFGRPAAQVKCWRLERRVEPLRLGCSFLARLHAFRKIPGHPQCQAEQQSFLQVADCWPGPWVAPSYATDIGVLPSAHGVSRTAVFQVKVKTWNLDHLLCRGGASAGRICGGNTCGNTAAVPGAVTGRGGATLL